MEYLKRYHLIATALLNFEKAGCDFYLSIAPYPALEPIDGLLRQLAYGKARELDIFAGMLTVCDFLLENCTVRSDLADTGKWLNAHTPNVYGEDCVRRLVQSGESLTALGSVIGIEESVLNFYREVRKKMPMNIGQIDAVIARQRTQIATLRSVREQLRNHNCQEHDRQAVLTGDTGRRYSA